jgi:integrase
MLRKRESLTFDEAARRVHAQLRPTWKNTKHAETWLATVENYVNPNFGKRPLHTICTADVLSVLSQIWTEKHETAKRLKQRLSTIFDWAKGARRFPHENPVNELKKALSAVKQRHEHMAAMAWPDLPAFMHDMSGREGVSARILEFLILTATRSGEARGARRSKIDRRARKRLIAGARMTRSVPLSQEVGEILEKVRGLDAHFVFPSLKRGPHYEARPQTVIVFKSLLKRIGAEGFTAHGYRSTFRDWCSESAHADREVAEAALSHATGNEVERAYAHFDVAFDLKDYDRIDHGYAATIHKAQGMTVGRTHVLATPGMDAHTSYVALSRHRDGMDLNHGRDDFASQDKLIYTLSRDRAKDMESDYDQRDPAEGYAERRGTAFHARCRDHAEAVPERLREAVDGLLDGLRQAREAPPGPELRLGPGREKAGKREVEREDGEDPENALRRARRQALVRHARASDAILEAKRQGAAPSDELRRGLGAAQRAFDAVRPGGWQDAEAAYNKDNSLAHEAGSGNPARAIRALPLETEIRTDPARSELARRPLRETLSGTQAGGRTPLCGGQLSRLQGRARGDVQHGHEPPARTADGVPAEGSQEATRHQHGFRFGEEARAATCLQPRHRPL